MKTNNIAIAFIKRLKMCGNFEILTCIKYFDHFFTKKLFFLCFLNNGALDITISHLKAAI